MTPAHVRRAVDLYLEVAWPEKADGRAARPRITAAHLEGADTMAELLARFEKEAGGDERQLRRYTLRLGNDRYPFMKFVVQEHLVGEFFFFSVDTHDNIDVRPDSPDYRAFEELKGYNRRLRDEIEARWDRADLPTNHDLRALVEELAKIELGAKKRDRLLLVDDEENVCQGLAALLRARGYQVEISRDGSEALERLARDPIPDLVLLDFEMPRLDGQEVLRRMRRDVRLQRVPVLMATAAKIELSQIQEVSGLLKKPYPRDVLFEMIGRILRERHGS